MNITTTVSTEIRADMARSRVTQADLAKRLGVSQPAVSRRLNGELPWDLDQLESICALFDAPLGRYLPPRHRGSEQGFDKLAWTAVTDLAAARRSKRPAFPPHADRRAA